MSAVASELASVNIESTFLSIQSPVIFNEHVFQSDPVHDAIYEELGLSKDASHNRWNYKPYIGLRKSDCTAVVVNTFHVRKLALYEHRLRKYIVNISQELASEKFVKYLQRAFSVKTAEQDYTNAFISMLDRMRSAFPQKPIILIESSSPSGVFHPDPYSYLYNESSVTSQGIERISRHAQSLGIKSISMDNVVSRIISERGCNVSEAYPFFLYKNGIRRDITHMSPVLLKVLTKEILQLADVDSKGILLSPDTGDGLEYDIRDSFLSMSPSKISAAVYYMIERGIGPEAIVAHKEHIPIHEYMLRTIRLYNTVVKKGSLSDFFEYHLQKLEDDATNDELFKRKYREVLLKELA